jgi:hypothetical protein
MHAAAQPIARSHSACEHTLSCHHVVSAQVGAMLCTRAFPPPSRRRQQPRQRGARGRKAVRQLSSGGKAAELRRRRRRHPLLHRHHSPLRVFKSLLVRDGVAAHELHHRGLLLQPALRHLGTGPRQLGGLRRLGYLPLQLPDQHGALARCILQPRHLGRQAAGNTHRMAPHARIWPQGR